MVEVRYSAGGVVIGPGNLVLLVNQNNDSWSLPKGHLEPEENEEDAATREIYEESGIQDITIISTLGSYERNTIAIGGIGERSDQPKHITMFLCITNQSELNPIDPDNPTAMWSPIQDVADKLTHPKDKEFFVSVTPKLLKFISQ